MINDYPKDLSGFGDYRLKNKFMKIYIDTSVINGLYANDALWIKEATKVFFSRSKKHSLCISDLVIAEIERTTNAVRLKKLLRTVAQKRFKRVDINENVESLARIYIDRAIVPQKYLPDALHIALATIYKIPVIVSWIFQHLVRHQTRVLVNEVNAQLKLSSIDICSPEEVD